MKTKFLAISILFCSTVQAQPEVNLCVQDDGSVIYQDMPCDGDMPTVGQDQAMQKNTSADNKPLQENDHDLNLDDINKGQFYDALVGCRPLIEARAQYKYRWTDGLLGQKLQLAGWHNKKNGSVIWHGNEIEFMNGFGVWIPHRYRCVWDSVSKRVISVAVVGGQ